MRVSIFVQAALLAALTLTACAPSPSLTSPAPADGMHFDQLRLESRYDVQISPDGKRLAYVSASGSVPQPPVFEIFVTEVGGLTRRLVQLETEPLELRWAADGQSLVYLQAGRMADGKLPMTSGFTLYRLGLTGAPAMVAESEQVPGKVIVGANADLMVLRGKVASASPQEPVRLYQPSTGTVKVVSEKETWTPVFSPDGGAIAFFEREGDQNALVLYTWATGERKAIPLATDTAPFSEVVWSPDGKGVTVFTADRAQKVTARPFQLDGTPGTERSLALPALEGQTEVAYELTGLSPDGRRLTVQRATAEIKRNWKPDVIVDDPLSSTLVVDAESGAVQKVLERYEWVLGWLDGNRLLTQRDHFLIADRKTEDGRLTVVTLP